MPKIKKAFAIIICIIIILTGFALFCRLYFSTDLENTSLTSRNDADIIYVNHEMSKGKADGLTISISRVKMSDSCEMLKIVINPTDDKNNYNIKNLNADLQFSGDFINGFYSNNGSDFHNFSGRGHDSNITTTNSSDGYCEIVLFLNNVEDEEINMTITYDVCGSGLYLFNNFESVSQEIIFPAM